MKQRVARLKGINDTYNASRNGLQLEYITDANLPIPSGEAGNRNVIPTDFKGMLSIYGRYIRISGDDPANGLAFHCQETGETYRIPPQEIQFNTPSRLIIFPTFPLTEGTWTLTLTTQYSRNRHLTQVPRKATLRFQVIASMQE